MKVLFIGARGLSGKYSVPDTMDDHIVSTLQSMDIECLHFPYREKYVCGININKYFEIARTDLGWIKSTPVDKLLLKTIKEYQPDLILTLLGNYTSPQMIEGIKAITDAPVAVWCQDHMGTLGRQYIIGSDFDFLFLKDEYMVEFFKRYTKFKQVHHLPEACNPDVHKSVSLTNDDRTGYACDITTAGLLYYYRAEMLSALKKYDLKLWGSVPAYFHDAKSGLLPFFQGRRVYTTEKAKIFNAAKISINTMYPMEIASVNARCFEIAGCGGFQFITENASVEKYFIPEKEIVTFRNINELIVKVEYYLNHDEERTAIALAGQKRAHKEHTYEIRMQKMLDTIFG